MDNRLDRRVGHGVGMKYRFSTILENCAAIANWRAIRDHCLPELIHSSRIISVVGDQVAPGRGARRSAEHATNAFISARRSRNRMREA